MSPHARDEPPGCIEWLKRIGLWSCSSGGSRGCQVGDRPPCKVCGRIARWELYNEPICDECYDWHEDAVDEANLAMARRIMAASTGMGGVRV